MLAAAVAGPVAAQSYCDSTMQNWSSTALQIAGADCMASNPWNTSGVVSAATPGFLGAGNPPPSLRFSHAFTLGTPPGTSPWSTIHFLHTPNAPAAALTFGPCPPTAATRIDLSVDYQALSYAPPGAFGGTIAFRWAAVQNGIVYLCDRCGCGSCVPPGSWQIPIGSFALHSHQSLGLSPSRFTAPVTGAPLVLGAGPTRFGVVTGNSCFTFGGCGQAQTAVGLLDNFCVSVQANIGTGCVGSLGVPGNEPGPALAGGVFSNTFTRLPFGLVVFTLGYSCTTSGFGPLPFELSGIGAPGCHLRHSLDAIDVVIGTPPTATRSFMIPGGLLGLRFYTQGFSFDAPANPLGLVASDAAAVLVQ